MPHSPYGSVTAEVVRQLREIVGGTDVLEGEQTGSYAKDETANVEGVQPEVVVRPRNTAQVSEVLGLANECRIPVTPRGAGTGLSGGAIPVYGGILLSLENMNRILGVEEDNFTATVEPGVRLSDFCKEVESHGLYYPVYPGEMSASLGGNVATNAGGMRAVKYGVTRNFVLGLEAVLPTGEVVETGGQYIKSSTAYDLTQLIVGSEGTLAVITRITLKLIPPPGRRHVVLVPFGNLQEAIDTVPCILKERILPMGIEFIEKDVVRLTEKFIGREIPIHDYEASLMIIIEAESDEDATGISNRIGDICLSHNARDVFVVSGNHAAELMAFREKAWPAIVHAGKPDMADVVVPRNRIAEFVRLAREASQGLGITTFMVGHAGDGNVHLAPMIPESEDGRERVVEYFRKVYELGASMGGTISGEHGIGSAKKEYVGIVLGRAALDLMRRIKASFDPNNIMNPGKIFNM